MNVRQLMRKYRIELLLTISSVLLFVLVALAEHIALGAGDGTLIGGKSEVPSYATWIGVPLDDVYIHCRFAQNLSSGRSFGFNPGTRISADTSPLWVVLLALVGAPGVPLELASVVLSALFFILISIGIYRTCRDLLGCGEQLSRLAGVLGILSSRLVWASMSGMEVTLATLLVFLVIEEHIRSTQCKRMRIREGVLLGLAIATRPECQLLAILALADWLVVKFKERDCDISQIIPCALAIVTIAAPVLLFPLITRGSVVNHSSVVQGAALHLFPSTEYLGFVLKILVTNNVLLLILLLMSLSRLRDDRVRLAIVFCFSLPLVQAWIAPQMRHHGRYMFPIFPIAVVVAITMWSEQAMRIKSALTRKLVMALLVGLGFVETIRWIGIEAGSVRNINDQHLAAVEWVRTLPKHDVLAVDDVGAIGYFANRSVVDLTGLVSPEAFPLQHDQDSVWMLARSKGANVFLIYNRWNVPFYEHHKDSLELLRTFRVRLPLMSSADTVMSAYRVKEAAAWH